MRGIIDTLLSTVIAGFLISMLGGSRVQIGGPMGAFVVVIFNVIAKHGYDGLLVATLRAGIILIAAGLFRLGQIIKFIPHPVVTGFTAGIAVIIASSQVKDFLGLAIGKGLRNSCPNGLPMSARSDLSIPGRSRLVRARLPLLLACAVSTRSFRVFSLPSLPPPRLWPS